MGIPRQSPPSPELKIFSDRLQKAVAFKKVDIADLAKDLEYKPDEIRRLLTGMREPSMKKLTLLANLLGCSADYLLGLAPEPQRADVVVEADTDALKPQPSERGQTSGRISGDVGRLIAMAPELPEFDAELLAHTAEFLIERNKKGLLKFVKIVRGNRKKETEKTKPIEFFAGKSKGEVGFGGRGLESDGDDLDEDELWGDDDFEEKKSDDEYLEDDDDFDDGCFDD